MLARGACSRRHRIGELERALASAKGALDDAEGRLSAARQRADSATRRANKAQRSPENAEEERAASAGAQARTLEHAEERANQAERTAAIERATADDAYRKLEKLEDAHDSDRFKRRALLLEERAARICEQRAHRELRGFTLWLGPYIVRCRRITRAARRACSLVAHCLCLM